MNEFSPELPRLKENLRRVIDAYAGSLGKKESTALMRLLGSAQARMIVLDPEADLKAGKYDVWMQQFSDAWPEGLDWPEGVPRPPARVAAAA